LSPNPPGPTTSGASGGELEPAADLAQCTLALAERLHDGGIELPARLREDLVVGRLPRAAGPVGTVARHGVEGVGDGEDARCQRNLGAAHPVRVAVAVPPLVVGADDVETLSAEECDPAEHLL